MGGGGVSLGFLVGFWEGWIGRGGDVPKASMASGMVLKAGFLEVEEVPFGCCSEGAIAAVVQIQIARTNATKQAGRM